MREPENTVIDKSVGNNNTKVLFAGIYYFLKLYVLSEKLAKLDAEIPIKVYLLLGPKHFHVQHIICNLK
jgi:hypothetical protein